MSNGASAIIKCLQMFTDLGNGIQYWLWIFDAYNRQLKYMPGGLEIIIAYIYDRFLMTIAPWSHWGIGL